MWNSIIECSGGHWLRAALVWICLVATVAVGMPRSEAEDHIASARMVAGEVKPSLAIEPVQEFRASVTHRVTAFDFNAASMNAYGDAEPVDPAPRGR